MWLVGGGRTGRSGPLGVCLGDSLYSVVFSRKVLTWRALPLLEALKAYHRWNLIRLIMLAVIAWGNLVLYYLTLNNIGGLCALLACLAALFCVPGKRKLMNELEITE